MAIETCFFDMGNVLVFFSHDLMCRNISRVLQWPEDRTRRFLLEEGRQWMMERGEMTEEQFLEEACHATGRRLVAAELQLAAADIFTPNESIVPVLKQLKSRGRRLVLLSNTSVTHLRFIEQRFSVLSLMDERVTSYETGAMKPDRKIYETALSKAAGPADTCFYTDDIPEYVLAGREFGIHARQFLNTAQLIRDLRELHIL